MATEKPRSFAQDLKTPSQKIMLLLVFVFFALFRSSSIELTSKCGNLSSPLNAANAGHVCFEKKKIAL
jgi:hypothetical protein